MCSNFLVIKNIERRLMFSSLSQFLIVGLDVLYTSDVLLIRQCEFSTLKFLLLRYYNVYCILYGSLKFSLTFMCVIFKRK